jgi:serine/threonine protein kinase
VLCADNASPLLHVRTFLGVVPLLDTFWDRPLGEGGKSSARVLVMPFLTCLAPRGRCLPLKLADVVLCLRNMLACLRKMHEERRVVHLDIKPSNLFVLHADTPATDAETTISEFLLADFGLSQVLWCLL